MNDEWVEKSTTWQPATATLTRPRTRLELVKAAFVATFRWMVGVVSVLLIVGTYINMPDILLALLAIAGAGLVLRFGIRDLRASEVYRT